MAKNKTGSTPPAAGTGSSGQPSATPPKRTRKGTPTSPVIPTAQPSAPKKGKGGKTPMSPAGPSGPSMTTKILVGAGAALLLIVIVGLWIMSAVNIADETAPAATGPTEELSAADQLVTSEAELATAYAVGTAAAQPPVEVEMVVTEQVTATVIVQATVAAPTPTQTATATSTPDVAATEIAGLQATIAAMQVATQTDVITQAVVTTPVTDTATAGLPTEIPAAPTNTSVPAVNAAAGFTGEYFLGPQAQQIYARDRASIQAAGTGTNQLGLTAGYDWVVPIKGTDGVGLAWHAALANISGQVEVFKSWAFRLPATGVTEFDVVPTHEQNYVYPGIPVVFYLGHPSDPINDSGRLDVTKVATGEQVCWLLGTGERPRLHLVPEVVYHIKYTPDPANPKVLEAHHGPSDAANPGWPDVAQAPLICQ